MPLQARAQIVGARIPRRITCRDRHINPGKRVLIQAEGLTSKALDAISCDCRAKSPGSNREPETRMGFMVREHS